MYVRIHTNGDERILAACDEDIIGKTFRGDGMRITVSETFYRGESVSTEAYIERMKSVSIMNLVGEEAVSIAVAQGHVSPENIIVIGGVKHAQVVMM
ncbi:MAG: DUF424 family protein [Candidatus Methanomethylophilaceae archaeon]|nr:DUF424 family protein [Candidatus Methanomethylophilaceae archaeon]